MKTWTYDNLNVIFVYLQEGPKRLCDPNTFQKFRSMKTFFLSILSLAFFTLPAQNPLLIPSTLSGDSIELTLQYGSHAFFTGVNTPTMGVNGNILGPTLMLKRGDFVSLFVRNQLNDTTTIHWHGMHVAPENDGGPHTTIAPGSVWNPSFTVLDKAATYWYHPHLHKKTNEHVSKGIAGLIIVKDDEEASMNLPRSYGVDDFPLVVQTKDFDANKEIIVHSNNDDIVMVNATVNPYLELPAQVVRFRILNGSSQRSFNFGLSNDKTFYQIASDGGLLSQSLPMTRLLLAPGERAEILIDLSAMNGQELFLRSFASELPNGVYGAASPGMMPGMTLNGYDPNPLNGSDYDILSLRVTAPTANPVNSIPLDLVQVIPIDEGTAQITRQLTFSPETMGQNQLNGDFLINGVFFDMDVINYEIPLDNTEIWELRNRSAISHPFHIHDVQFYILSRDGVPPPLNERGRKDVVMVAPQETVRFITKFETFANSDVPFMYHCHLLTHEDKGMMGQFLVTRPLSVESVVDEGILIYPNPGSGSVLVKAEGPGSLSGIEVFDQNGKLIRSFAELDESGSQHITGLTPGIYIIRIKASGKYIHRKLIVI